MIERLIENWLTKASEKSFQIPFCYMLANEGYTILHLTRHCGMELGKDIIAKDPEGRFCAFQLKGAPRGKIKLSQWKKDLAHQAHQMVSTPLIHPSVPPSAPYHKSFLVTNGELEEEVSASIDAENRKWTEMGRPEFVLHTIVKGELVERATKLGLNFIPPDLDDFRLLLELFLEDGTDIINKHQFSRLIESFFEKAVKPGQRPHLIRGSALLTALATSSFTNRENHVAVIEAWMMFVSYLLWYCEKYSIDRRHWKNEFEIANQIIWTSMENLWNEISDEENFLVGNHFQDVFVRNARLTWYVGLLSAWGIYLRLTEGDEQQGREILRFCNKHQDKLDLWGESAIPNFLAYYWLSGIYDATDQPTKMLPKLLRTISSNVSKQDIVFPGVYHGIDESLALRWESDTEIVLKKNDKGASHYIEGITHLFVREGLKQEMTGLWPQISKVYFKSFQCNDSLDFYRWRNRKGTEVTKIPRPTQSWQEIRALSFEDAGSGIPNLLKNHAALVPLFLIVYPHRGNASILRWMQTRIYEHL